VMLPAAMQMASADAMRRVFTGYLPWEWAPGATAARGRLESSTSR
jgi:hypothetical protein